MSGAARDAVPLCDLEHSILGETRISAGWPLESSAAAPGKSHAGLMCAYLPLQSISPPPERLNLMQGWEYAHGL